MGAMRPTFMRGSVEEVEEPGLLHHGPGLEHAGQPERLVRHAAARVQEHATQEAPHLVL